MLNLFLFSSFWESVFIIALESPFITLALWISIFFRLFLIILTAILFLSIIVAKLAPLEIPSMLKAPLQPNKSRILLS